MPINITKCNTISSIIEYGKSLDISHDKLHFKATILDSNGRNIIINYSSLIDKYFDFLQKAVIDVTLTDREYELYIYQPKKLSFNLYGTTELWSALLRINNLTSISEFTLKKLKLFTTQVFEILNEILILEDKEIKENRQDNGL